jgi:Zn-dependent protease
MACRPATRPRIIVPMQGLDLGEILWKVAVVLPPLIFAITFHETAHGWAAKQLGDMTAFREGRISLNPFRHIDPIGTLIVPLGLFAMTLGQLTFGWAKPVPVNFANLRRPRRDMMLVAIAGPVSNFLMAALWSFLIFAQIYVLPVEGEVGRWLFEMRTAGIVINVALGMLNLLPIPPLDGSRILAAVLPARAAAVLDRIEPFGVLIVIGLVVVLLYTGQLGPLIEPPLGAMVRFFQGLPGVVS